MKKLFLTSIISVLFIFNIQAQEYGGGISYGTEVEKVALNLKANFEVNTNLIISTSANFFMPEKNETGDTTLCTALTTVNFDGSYRFFLSEKFALYPIIGINYSRMGTIVNGEAMEAKNYYGANLGGAIKYKNLFCETKYVTSNKGQIVVTLGYVFIF